jgi:serine/threonine protein phosphatase PrpC
VVPTSLRGLRRSFPGSTSPPGFACFASVCSNPRTRSFAVPHGPQPTYSGTTACVVLLRDDKLYVSNCGDSRAVLARRGGTTTATRDDARRTTNQNGQGRGGDDRNGDGLIAIPLSIDQNPDSPGEKERILSSGGYVSPPPEPGLSSRVWLDRAHTQIGLAMSRSIGDHAVKDVGVIARPVVTTREIEAEDEFVIVATDGVWEFLSSEDAVDIVGRHLYGEGDEPYNDDGSSGGGRGAYVACEALIKAASEKWHEHEGDYRDDITAIVIRLKDLWTAKACKLGLG